MSFISKRIQQQKDGDKKDDEDLKALFGDDSEAIPMPPLPGQPASAIPPKAEIKGAPTTPVASPPLGQTHFERGVPLPPGLKDVTVGEGVNRVRVAEVREDGTWLLDTGYVVPSKKRTPPKLARLRKQLRAKLLATPDEADTWKRYDEDKIKILTDRLNTVLQKMGVTLDKSEYEQLRTCLLDDLLGFGAIQSLVENKGISEVMVNGPEIVFAEQKGKLKETEIVFDDEDHVYWTAQRIVRPLMRTLDRSNPMVDARLPDGSRVHLVTLPSALNGTTITIRKFPEKRLTVEQLIEWKSFTREVAEFFRACVVSRLNIVVAGGTGSGKTTLLNVLSAYIPEDERIITVEDSAELQLAQRHVVRLETCPPMPGTEDKGKLEIRDLVKGTLRMRPDRLVVGECRSGEALDMLQAMNTGHDGSLTTVHANTPRDAVARLETLCMMAGMDLPVNVIRAQIASAIHLFVQQSRLKDGSRKVVQITEMQGMEGERVTLQDLFVYRTANHQGQGYSHEGGGSIEPMGFPPKFMHQLKQFGFNLPPSIFGAGQNKFSKG
ncbi:MAG: CpaF family protein [Anaerolineae bacterium]|nr:CpaF family protein [Anaerolineae bacterium]MDW8171921.1 CpaF family protein [Anaerolineae bacterium]